MKNINKILAVSFIAMLAVPAAQAKIVAETMLSSEAGHYHTGHTVQDEINAKQDTISDLTTIRSGAAAGATAVQSVTQGSTNGTISVDGTNVAVKGLGSAAYTASTDYQTAANSKVAAKSSGTYNKITAGNAVNTNLVALDTGIGEINTKIGTVTQGKTVVQMINEAQAAATPGIATDTKTGVVKGGGNVAIANDGTMTVDLSGKADKATTLSGYGITDAYTKTETGTQITNAVNALNSTQDGTGNVVVGVSQTNGKVTVTKGSIAESDVTNLTTDLAAKQTKANMVTNTSQYNEDIDDANKYPNMAVVDAMISTNNLGLTDQISGKIDKIVADDANKIMVRNNTGTYVPSQGSAITVANDGTLTVNTATKATQDGSGNTITSTYATQTALGITNTNVSNLTTRVSTAEGNITANANKIGSGTISAKGSDGTTAAADLVAAVNAIDDRLSSATSTANNAVAKAGHTKNRTLSVKSDGTVVDGTVSGNTGVSASVDNDGNITVSGTAATSDAFGVVKTGANITNTSGTISVADATTGAKGVVQLADAAAVTAGTAGRVVDAAQLKTVANSVTTTNNNKQDKLGNTNVTTDGSGNVVTAVTAENGVVTVAKGMTAIPEPDATNVTGTLVLTATPKDGGGYDYQWEELGR